MGIESWMVSLVFSIGGVIAVLAIGKYKTEQNQKEIEDERKARVAVGIKLDKVTEEVAEHKVRLHNAPSMEDVRKEFVSKEMFKQMEKHIDGRFDNLGKSLEQIFDNQSKMLAELRDK